MNARLDGYLARIGFAGTPRVDADTLVAVHRAHLRAIPYENLDVQLGRPVGLEVDGIFTKLVVGRRGGWCYEMNGLLGWALEAMGFPVTRLSAGVMRAERGDAALGNHLALWVHLDEPWLADVGFGDGTLEPVPVRAGRFRQGALEFALEALPQGWWRLHNHPHGAAASFDFRLAPADTGLLTSQCQFLQTSLESPFTRVAVVQRHVDGGLALLRGRVLKLVRAGRAGTVEVTRREVADQREYLGVLRDWFDLTPPDPDRLWARVAAQHAAYLAELTGRPH
ncbi:MAG: arylamine N-acetyltransferase [Pseudomonadales bacterium]